MIGAGLTMVAAMVLGQADATKPATVQIDCAKRGEADLVKKFDMCQTGWSPLPKWRKAAQGKMRPLKLRHIRIVGALLHKRWGGKPLLAPVLKMMAEEGAAAYLCMDPNVLEPRRMNRKPRDMDAWRRLLTETARQAKGYGAVWYEVWNEPNYSLFFEGSRDELHELYEVMVETVSKVDPKARFVGPGFTSGGLGKWAPPFLEFVDKRGLPLHAFAFHDFGRGYELPERWMATHARWVSRQLDKYERFKDTEIHVGECSFFGEPKNGGPADRTEAAAHLPELFRVLAPMKRVTLVQWAQLFDTGAKNNKWGDLGVIDVETGKPKPKYNVFLMYAMMPVRRVAEAVSGPVRCLAGADDETVAVMLYNTTAAASPCRVTVRNHPFGKAKQVNLAVLSVDKDHSSFWETPGSGELEVTDRRTLPAGPGPIELDVPIPGPGVKLLMLSAKKMTFPAGVIESVAGPAKSRSSR